MGTHSNAATPRRDASRVDTRRLIDALDGRSLVLIGMMGAGKSSVGRRLAKRLGLAFVDADKEIEEAAGQSIQDMFETHGETYFRDGERRVIERILRAGSQVLATGGGAFMDEMTRTNIKENAIAIWLKADLPVLMERVRRRSHRPLLKNDDPEAVMRQLLEAREPVYATADITVWSRDVPHDAVVDDIIIALEAFFDPAADKPGPNHDDEGCDDPLRLSVDLGERGYNILIGPGLIANAARHIVDIAPSARLAIITDAHVGEHHLESLQQALATADITAEALILAPGERTKCFAELERVSSFLLDQRMERGDLVVALGGGVIGDLAGFAAAILRRGMRFVQMPTSLLAQVDSSVGGKTGIDMAQGKNLIGTFHQPALVLADTSALDTLPAREFRAGYAEIAKYGLLGDAPFFAWLEAAWQDVFAGGPARIKAIAKSCQAKAAIVARDEREAGERALLNLGHTFGHAFEAATGYGERLLHGEAIAIGMVAAFELSTRLGHAPTAAAIRVKAHFDAVGLPTRMSDIHGDLPDADGLMTLIAQDKKVARGALTFILAKEVGQAFIEHGIDAETVRTYLSEQLSYRR